MFYKSHFGTVLTSVLALFMGLVMAMFIIVLNALPFNWVNLFELTAEINLIVFVVSLFVPYNAWGDWFANLFPVQTDSPLFKLLQALIPSIVLNSCNTLICTGTSIFYHDAIPKAARMTVYLQSCAKAWLPCFIVSYFASFIGVWLGKTIAQKFVPTPALER
ncbi:hypothetical protein [Lactobacillus xylocopicola]|uniref:DUF2798 domain-containing protein n=1 Tax=Lactobacillus xylocopicola TaxID=2976676 RepID=A0ABM8BF68_9LACO|nr:hypothetical protein [Lactobacillus xylocopicola]BDR59890.1 hypothetical protein KIM322_01510 [Lactobacillus xylocopicola]